MDLLIYLKENVRQPDGSSSWVYKKGVFDLQPVFSAKDKNLITGANLITDRGELEQACLFSTIKQKGTDPLSPNEGVRWSESFIGEIPQETLMLDIRNAVFSVTPAVTVSFDTIKTVNGTESLKYDINIPKGITTGEANLGDIYGNTDI